MTQPAMLCPGGCGPGVCDSHRSICECPMTHTGKHCETPLLPACDIGGSFSIPIRSWLLHAFHDGAANQRWPASGASTAIGPVPCDCLRQFVTAPFMLERTRLRYMRSFTPRCIDLPGGVSLEQFLAQPDGYRDRWRGFSLAAAHDALRLGAEPSMRGAPLDADASGAAELPALIEQLDVWIAKGRKVRNTRPAGYEISTLRARLPPLVLPSSAAPLPLLPLSRCDGRCGGIGWCEDARPTLGRTSRTGITGHGSTAPRCGCFSPHGLKSPPGLHTPYGRCNDPTAWRADRQPSPHWGPSCMLNCSGRGSCDWQGFCRCEPGFYGIDCALTRDSATGEAVVVPTSLEARAAAKELRSGAPRPLTPLAGMLDGDDGLVGANYRRQRRRAGSRARGGGDTDESSDGRGGRHRDGRRAPLYYVVETPPLLRFGVDFAGHVEHSMSERMLRSSHRAATPEAAHYLWYPGAPLVIDGHRLLARLWHVCTEWLGASPERMLISDGGNLNASFVGVGAKPRLPLVLMPLLTERASMDSFQLSYADEDREEWPGLVHSPHVRAIRELAPGCTEPAPAPRAGVAAEAIDAAVDGAAGNSRRQGPRIGGRRPHRGPPTSALSLSALEGRLERRLLERRARLGRATLYSLFRGGGYDSFRAARRTCPLPASILPWSPQRVWAGLQFSGNPRNPVFFQRGKDVVIPQMLMIRGVGSHADQPTCEQMKRSSPLSSFFEREATSKRRTTLLWFGGHSGHGDARSAMFRLHQNRKGFVLVDSLRHATKRLDAINMSLSSAFCWVPRGQGQGDPTRHMVAIFHGCVPVFTLGHSDDDDALPFDELLPWDQFSLRVPANELRSLPMVVNAKAQDQAGLRAMQSQLGCVWRALFWTSLKGSCFGEVVKGDAFDALMHVLRKRVAGASALKPRSDGSSTSISRTAATAGVSGRGMGSVTACDVAGKLPSHLSGGGANARRALQRLAPGFDARLLGEPLRL